MLTDSLLNNNSQFTLPYFFLGKSAWSRSGLPLSTIHSALSKRRPGTFLVLLSRPLWSFAQPLKPLCRVLARLNWMLLVWRPQTQMIDDRAASYGFSQAFCGCQECRLTIKESDEMEHKHTTRDKEARRNTCHKKSETMIPGISECRQHHNLTCKFPELSDHILTEAQTAELFILFSTLHVSSTEVLALRLIGTCAGRPQTTEYLTTTTPLL